MKVIILCAGRGISTGLNYPKCLYRFSNGKTLIEKNLIAIKKAGFKNKDIIFATGFKDILIKSITKNKYVYIFNRFYKSTNMVYSFYNVIRRFKSSDYLIMYADIIFDFKDLLRIKKSKKDIITLVDKDWLKKWRKKKNYLNDLEELAIKKKKVLNIGKKTHKSKKIDGRFVGITKFSKSTINTLIYNDFFKNLLKENKKIDFTNLLMKLINNKFHIYALKKKLNWFEFDRKEDFVTYEKKFKIYN